MLNLKNSIFMYAKLFLFLYFFTLPLECSFAQSNTFNIENLKSIDKTCKCYKQISKDDVNVYILIGESNPFNMFLKNKRCLKSELHIYKSKIDLIRLHNQFIGNDFQYMFGLDSISTIKQEKLLKIKLYGINPLLNTSNSTEHRFEVDYDMVDEKIKSIRVYDSY